MVFYLRPNFYARSRMIFKPFIEQGDSLKLDSYDSWEEKSIRPHKKPGDSFVDRISELFENED
jgi:hypothetical protein